MGFYFVVVLWVCMYIHVQFWQPLVSSGALHLVFETGFLTGLECLKASWPAILSDLLISASPLVAFCVSTEDQIQVIMTVQHSVDQLSYFPSLWFFEVRREKKKSNLHWLQLHSVLPALQMLQRSFVVSDSSLFTVCGYHITSHALCTFRFELHV